MFYVIGSVLLGVCSPWFPVDFSNMLLSVLKEVKEDESKEGPKELEGDAPTDKRAKVTEGHGRVGFACVWAMKKGPIGWLGYIEDYNRPL